MTKGMQNSLILGLGIAELQHSKNPVQTSEFIRPSIQKKVDIYLHLYTNHVYNLKISRLRGVDSQKLLHHLHLTTPPLF